VQAEYEIDHPRQGRLTNVVSIWDRVVESKEKAVLRVPRARNKYKLKDRGHHLRGLPVNVTLQWNVMPIAGRVRSEKRVFEGITFPNEYISAEPNERPDGRPSRRRLDPNAPHRAPEPKPRRNAAETKGERKSEL
jgi:hypothetical protein